MKIDLPFSFLFKKFVHTYHELIVPFCQYKNIKYEKIFSKTCYLLKKLEID